MSRRKEDGNTGRFFQDVSVISVIQRCRDTTKSSIFALSVDEKLKLLDNRSRIFTEKRISDILSEVEIGTMHLVYQITITTLIYHQPIPKLPPNLTIGGVW